MEERVRSEEGPIRNENTLLFRMRFKGKKVKYLPARWGGGWKGREGKKAPRRCFEACGAINRSNSKSVDKRWSLIRRCPGAGKPCTSDSTRTFAPVENRAPFTKSKDKNWDTPLKGKCERGSRSLPVRNERLAPATQMSIATSTSTFLDPYFVPKPASHLKFRHVCTYTYVEEDSYRVIKTDESLFL